VQPGDIVGVGIHTGNALRGYEIGTLARQRGATVVFGGIHATLHHLGAAHLTGVAVVPPLVMMWRWNDPRQTMSETIQHAGR
jgi:hypothetical protein